METTFVMKGVRPPGMRYGRFELRQVVQMHMWRSLVISVVLNLSFIGGYYMVEWLGEDDDSAPTIKVRILKYSELGPPPSLTNAQTIPQVAVGGSSVRPTIGIPVPVPDADVNPEQTFATQQELAAVQSAASEGNDAGGDVAISQDIRIDDEPGMNDFVAVEKEPQIVKEVKPIYPDMARIAGIEGVVWVKILVGRDGRPKKAVIIKEIPPGIFAKASTEAAMQYLFTPALMSKGPVQVWISIPFRFRIRATT